MTQLFGSQPANPVAVNDIALARAGVVREPENDPIKQSGVLYFDGLKTRYLYLDGDQLYWDDGSAVVQVSADEVPVAWTTYNTEADILTPQTGITLSAITIERAAYILMGPLCFFEVQAKFTTTDCGAGDIELYIKIPAALTIANTFPITTGMAVLASGSQILVWGSQADTTHLRYRFYNNAAWADGVNNRLRVTGNFTWAAV